ncbi:sigma-54-dependent Fis family transcriptional regulator [Neomegalonema sp.]|uniref:sigma-54-dependent Fis family transcriptional regulator n=1 Tax=Neomegalonema sp. TaxID=2039713 RepID=UPI0026219758|nr:sigma-54-dependent Fis family transcriptional regulator [Neomegalonema sp.]MDD2869989.1 sigma-54-dependent Fis family transcriptional regulator [Neomegalonema sp.]
MIDLATGFHTRTGMFDDWLDQRATMRAWEDFLTYRDLERSQISGVRREILESWSRSLALGIDANAKLAPLDESHDRLEEARKRNAELRSAAEGPFAKIGPLLAEAEALVMLTDAEGLVLEQVGDTRTREAARSIHLVNGGNWDEAVIGTNAIGTALRTGRPTIVHASEHFCQGIKTWTCAAAPIRDPVDGATAGLVDLSGSPSIFRPHNVAMIAAVAQKIETSLAERYQARRARLLEAFFDSGIIPEQDDAVVILDQMGRAMYQRGGAKFGDLAQGRQLIALSDSMSDHEIAKAMPPHLQPSRIQRLLLGGEFGGAALIVSSRRTARPQPPKSAPLVIPARAGVGADALTMIGHDQAFVEAIELARRAAGAGASVLIQGETGVGKELFARLVHSGGKRRGQGPFITLNCGAISSELFGSELFGHVAGAFTGATREGKAGKLEQADGGLLCLDEIGEMPLDLQPYLLRVLEQRAVYRIGCSRRRQVDVQLVAMTNRDLGQEVELGRFRRDLYFRIGTVTIEVPPLRERRGDIPLLADHFNRMAAERLSRDPLDLPDSILDRLLAYSWPGNVREMRNVFERIYLMAQGTAIVESDLPAILTRGTEGGPAALAASAGHKAPSEPESLNDVEARAIRRALVSEEGNLTRVAAVLGVSRPTLYRKLKALGIRRTFG